MKLLFLLIFSFLLSAKAYSAACCGGGFASPSLIAGDNKAQVTLGMSQAQIFSDVNSQGIWSDRALSDKTSTFRIDAAHIFKDRWQWGLRVPLTQREIGSESSAGLGDVSSSLGYEYLPDWDYNPWRPKGLGYVQLTAPTSPSVFESPNNLGIGSRGRGFWSVGAGTLLTKGVANWDGYLNMETHYSFKKSVSNQQLQGQVKPGMGTSIDLGIGYNIDAWRFGGSVSSLYEAGIDVSGSQNSQGSLQRSSSLSLQVSYLYNLSWAVTASYTDQSLLGSPWNTSISKTMLFQLQRSWSR